MKQRLEKTILIALIAITVLVLISHTGMAQKINKSTVYEIAQEVSNTYGDAVYASHYIGKLSAGESLIQKHFFTRNNKFLVRKNIYVGKKLVSSTDTWIKPTTSKPVNIGLDSYNNKVRYVIVVFYFSK